MLSRIIDHFNNTIMLYVINTYNKYRMIKQILDEDKLRSYSYKVFNNSELCLMYCSRKKITKETYEDYELFLQTRDFSKDKWIYDIIDGKKETDKVQYRDSNMLIVPSYIWNEKDDKLMYLLGIPTDKSIRSIRSLGPEHLELLKLMREQLYKHVKNKYGYNRDELKVFLHYSPSCYHLHIHVALVTNNLVNSSIEYSHLLDQVIENIELVPDYYKRVTLNVLK